MTEERKRILDFISGARELRAVLVRESLSPQPERPHFERLYGGVNNAYMDFRGQPPIIRSQSEYSQDDGPGAA